MKKDYKPQFISWCESYEEEEKELRRLINGNPADIGLLKQEYYELTGKLFKRKKNEQ